jgi:hypothetical protein
MLKSTCLIAALLVSASLAGAAETIASGKPYFTVRDGLTNCRIRFANDKEARVAYMGGSITEMNGYRPMVCSLLQKRFPQTKFDFINAGISSTCSTTGAFRTTTDVFAKGRVDLLLVEFAVNDNQDARHTPAECIRGMEGILRVARRHNPCIDVIFLHFVNQGHLANIQAGKMPHEIVSHDKTARHYAIPSINLAREIAERTKAGEFDWRKFGGCHPSPFGNRIYADEVSALFDAAWSKPLPKDAKAKPYPMPEKLLDPHSYVRGRFIAPKQAKIVSGWQLGVPPWKQLKGGKRGRFTNIPMLAADKPGAAMTLQFTGTAIGIYIVAGPDAGIVEFSVDGGAFKPVDLFHHYSRGLHYPRTCMFAADLKDGKHELTLRTADKKNPKSAGHAARIIQFVAN